MHVLQIQNERCILWGLLGTRNLSSILGIWSFFENFSTQFLARFWGLSVYFESHFVHFARYLRILINEDLMSRSWKLTCVGFCLVLSYLRRVTVSSEPTSQTKYILCGKTWVRWIMIINPASSLPNPLSAPKSILRIKCRTLLQQIYKTICYFILYLISIFYLINRKCSMLHHNYTTALLYRLATFCPVHALSNVCYFCLKLILLSFHTHTDSF